MHTITRRTPRLALTFAVAVAGAAAFTGCGGDDDTVADTETVSAVTEPETSESTTVPPPASGPADQGDGSTPRSGGGQTLRESAGDATLRTEAKLNDCFRYVSAQATDVDDVPVEPAVESSGGRPPLHIYPLDPDEETGVDSGTDMVKALRELVGRTGRRGSQGILAQRYASAEGSVIDDDLNAAGPGGFAVIRNMSVGEARELSEQMQQDENLSYNPRWLFGGSLFVVAEVNTPEGWIEACFSDN